MAATSPPPAAAASQQAQPQMKPEGCPEGMVFIPGGKLTLTVEPTPRSLETSSFCIDRTEVTARAYRACVADPARACTPAEATEYHKNGTIYVPRKPYCNPGSAKELLEHPVTCMTWQQAEHYCRSLGRRLPTQEEWEMAARGPDGRMYPWGTELPTHRHANLCGPECAQRFSRRLPIRWWPAFDTSDGSPSTAPVGAFSLDASAFGVRDLYGNVSEWTATVTCYSEGKCNEPSSDGERIVIMGEGWRSIGADRVPWYPVNVTRPETRGADLGFRCAFGPAPGPIRIPDSAAARP
ncbi:SUMF1/EgtB/PvdO family nonheme iron enzyme [Polyangium jinanense]|uniref:formylglycine-generating enzyme family protein n=1 Tax=Polyangium jinanense TaxID=2829994 RepID=UPI002340BE38|nr:SUMF1/EgtB/PvdO family nonheme iron enzyme [Polyangium jinanense]MDC3960933.1 SUMF1/EgtB/PvdO family nonheme iron enzyme [Polyangium jinanense]